MSESESSSPNPNDCEAIVHDLLHCLITNKNDKEKCVPIERVIHQCNSNIEAMKGVPQNTNYCVDEIFDYSRCAIKLNTSMCSNEYKMLHECKLRRKRFLFGEDLGILQMNPQARKKW
jgi:hypothetical protein